MSLPLLIAVVVLTFSSSLALFYCIRDERTRRRLALLELEQKNRQFEENVLTEIHDSLDTEISISNLTHILTKHMHSFLTYSTVSTLLIHEHKLTFHAYAAESVSHLYIEDVKQAMLESLAALEKNSYGDTAITEEISGDIVETRENVPAASFIHLPLKLHATTVAVITLTSTQPHHFKDEDIQTLQRIVAQVSKSLSKLDAAQQVEKGRLTAMLANLTDGLVMIDSRNKLQVISPAAKYVLGLHGDRLTTMDVLSALPIHFDFRSKIETAMSQQQTSEIAGVVLKNKQLRCLVSPVYDTTGATLGVSIIMRDETLKNAVPRMKEDFTNIIVHELRNPLTSIKASSELLISPIEFSKEEQTKLIQLIYQQSNKLLTDVQQILDAAKLESGVFTIHKQQADLKQLIKEVTTLFLPQAQENMLNLVVDIDPSLPAFSFDPRYLNHALSNILSNSLKFTSTGGTIQVRLKQKPGAAIITITDTGAGIAKDKQHKLFHKFSQLEEASATVGKGLGLYLVKGIIEAHNGTITIDSDQGRGTTISLTLPLTEATHLPTSSTTPPSEQQRMMN